MWDRRAKFVSNHDGDTVTVVLDQGFGDTKQINVRLFGVFAPELKQKGGKECKDFTANWFAREDDSVAPEWNIIVTTIRDKSGNNEDMSFARYVGIITSLDGSRNLNHDIQEFIMSRLYSGGTGSK